MRKVLAPRGLAAAVIGCGAASVAMAQGVMDQMPWDTMEKVTIVTAIGASAIIGYKACEWLWHRARGGKGSPFAARVARQILEETGFQPQREQWPGSVKIPSTFTILSQDGFDVNGFQDRPASPRPRPSEKPRKVASAQPRRSAKRR